MRKYDIFGRRITMGDRVRTAFYRTQLGQWWFKRVYF